MQDLLIKMAKEAVDNKSLIANSIQSYCRKNKTTWAGVVEQLNTTDEQLAKLALCRQPTKQSFAQDLAQISKHTNIKVNSLTPFLQSPSLLSSLKQTLLSKRPSTQKERGNQPMMKRRAITFVIALIAIVFVSAFIFNQPTNNNATLHVSTGTATVTQAGSFGSPTTSTVQAGETITLSTDDVIEMAANSTAELFLFEGSQVDLAENTKLELTELTNNESDHQIYMTLFNGRIINRVTKLLGVDDAYEVRTPSSTASVRGTIFSVAVLDENATEVNVTEGVVEVALGNDVAQVHAGEIVTAVTSQPLNVQPADEPESDPTATPTDEPTDTPTDEPTDEPAQEPTEEPTDEPTEEATDEPTEESDGENPGRGSGNNGNGDGSNGNNDGTGNDGNNGNGSGNNGNGDASNGNNDGTGNDGNNGNGSGNNGNGDGSNGNNDGTGNDGNNGNGSDNNGNGDGSNGDNGGTGNDGNNGNSGDSGNGGGNSGNGGNNKP